MSDRPPSLGLVADRRIREAAAQAPPRIDVRGPVAKTVGTGDGTPRTPERAAGASLTRRERRVKDILLKELQKLHRGQKTWAAKLEREHLADTLDVAFIDREIAKMETSLRPRPVLWAVLGAFALLYMGMKVATHFGDPLTWLAAFDVLLGVAWPAAMAFGMVQQRKATERRLWIYQALRELSDADEADVQLDESVRLADLLIDRIVAAEDAAASAPLHRIRT